MNHIIYVASPESQQIHIWQMDHHGKCTFLQMVYTPGQGQPMVIHPTQRYLYIGMRPIYSILSYHIDKEGYLSKGTLSLQPGCPTYLTINLKSKSLYCVSYRNSCLSVSNINEQGIIEIPTQVLKGLINCHSANIDITNQILWVPCLKEDRIRLYCINKLGYLQPTIPEAINTINGAGPRHMVFHPNGHYAYVINEFNGMINVISINIDYVPDIVQTIDMLPSSFCNIQRWAADIHITPNGRWLYCCDRTTSVLSHFEISNDGSMLNLVNYQETEVQPRSFAIDTQGKFLVIAGQKSNYIRVYAIESKTGNLISIERYLVGKSPSWVVIHCP